MKIRIIGEKAEINSFLKNVSEIVSVKSSRLCKAREGGYRCYIDVDSKEFTQLQSVLAVVEYTDNIITIREFLSMLKADYYMIVIEYYIEKECEHCRRVFIHREPEYCSQFFLSDIKKMFEEKSGYYSEYPFVFDDTLINIEEDVEICGNRITITVSDERTETTSCIHELCIDCKDDNFYYGDSTEPPLSAKDYPDVFFN